MARVARVLLAALAVCVLAPGRGGSIAHAQEPDLLVDAPPRDVRKSKLRDQPKHQLAYINSFGLRYNALGAANIFDTVYRRRMFLSDKDALKQNFFGVGFSTMVAPVTARFSAMVDVQPLTLFQFYGRVWVSSYFGTANLIASFPSADSDFSDATIAERAEQPETENYPGVGGEASMGALLRGIQIGPVALRNHVRAFYIFYDLRRDGRVKYEQAFDLLMPNRGWSLLNEFDAIYMSNVGLMAILRYTYATPFYRDRDYEMGIRPANAPRNDYHALGPSLGYVFKRKPGGRFDAPTILLSTMWYLKHRYRAGQEVNQAIPQVALGFQFRGDFLAKY